MSYENKTDSGKQSGGANIYLYIFLPFIAIIAIAFFAMRGGETKVAAKIPALIENKPEQVVVTKDPHLAEKKQKLLNK